MATVHRGSVDDTTNEPRLLLPFLAPLYDLVVPLAWPLARFGAGAILAVHGWRKIVVGSAPMVDAFSKMGFSSPLVLYYFLMFVELVGGVCIAVGFFTRFFAAAATIEMGYIMFVLYLPNGFSWLNRGYEFVLLWGVMLLAVWLRGGGALSVDRLLKRQL
jgi:putative oxidoreductase